MTVVKVIHATKESFLQDVALALGSEIRVGWEVKPAQNEPVGSFIVKATFLVDKNPIIELHEGIVYSEVVPLISNPKPAEFQKKTQKYAEELRKLLKEKGLEMNILVGSFYSL